MIFLQSSTLVVVLTVYRVKILHFTKVCLSSAVSAVHAHDGADSPGQTLLRHWTGIHGYVTRVAIAFATERHSLRASAAAVIIRQFPLYQDLFHCFTLNFSLVKHNSKKTNKTMEMLHGYVAMIIPGIVFVSSLIN